MTLLDDIFGSDRLSAADIKRPIEVVIDSVTPVKFDDGPKLEISFDGCEKKLLCNKTNAKTIAKAYGAVLERWKGCKVIMDVHDTPLGPGIWVRIPPEQPTFVADDEGSPF